jgi:hypothetical protein
MFENEKKKFLNKKNENKLMEKVTQRFNSYLIFRRIFINRFLRGINVEILSEEN